MVSLEIDPGRYGIPDDVYGDGDIDRVQALLQRLAADDAYRHQVADNARNLFESEFEQSMVASQYGDAIQRVFASR